MQPLSQHLQYSSAHSDDSDHDDDDDEYTSEYDQERGEGWEDLYGLFEDVQNALQEAELDELPLNDENETLIKSVNAVSLLLSCHSHSRFPNNSLILVAPSCADDFCRTILLSNLSVLFTVREHNALWPPLLHSVRTCNIVFGRQKTSLTSL